MKVSKDLQKDCSFFIHHQLKVIVQLTSPFFLSAGFYFTSLYVIYSRFAILSGLDLNAVPLWWRFLQKYVNIMMWTWSIRTVFTWRYSCWIWFQRLPWLRKLDWPIGEVALLPCCIVRWLTSCCKNKSFWNQYPILSLKK